MCKNCFHLFSRVQPEPRWRCDGEPGGGLEHHAAGGGVHALADVVASVSPWRSREYLTVPGLRKTPDQNAPGEIGDVERSVSLV